MARGAKNPNKTGQRCIICYAWWYKIENQKSHGPKEAIDHEKFCPDYKP